MNINKLKINNGGYAILFSVVVVSIISMIAIGLSNTTYKQLILSSLANDSQIAFYQSDTGSECALYADNKIGLTSIGSSWSCGKLDDSTSYTFNITSSTSGDPNDYTFMPTVNTQAVQCFKFNITKSVALPVATNIYARGYNSCDSTSQKTVEREIKVTY